jgi:endonuclease-3
MAVQTNEEFRQEREMSVPADNGAVEVTYASPLQDRALEIHRRLVELYGDHPDRPRLDPVAELVSTILSQNTNDRNRDRAYDRLLQRFPTWEAVRDAPAVEVAEAIRTAGLAQSKAPRIQAALRRISAERGVIDLAFLASLPLEEARAWLTAMDGIGPKTAAIVLLFAFGRPAFPVDTHIHRVTRRLGLIPESASREKAHMLMEALMPPETYYALHLNLIRHGRETCHPRRPACGHCCLLDLCPYGRTLAPQKEGEKT